MKLQTQQIDIQTRETIVIETRKPKKVKPIIVLKAELIEKENND